MSKIISQETFNNVVKENIELFDMSLEAAIIEAKQQFEAQQVNLYNIITDQTMFQLDNDSQIVIKTHPIIPQLLELQSLCSSSIIDHQFEKIDPILDSLRTFFQSDLAYRLMGAKNNGKSILESILKLAVSSTKKQSIRNCLLTICSFVSGQPDVVDAPFLEYLVGLAETGEAGDAGALALVFRALSLCCCKHEANKQVLIGGGEGGGAVAVIPLAVRLLDRQGLESKDLTKDVCLFLRNLILDDDIRVAFGRGTETAKAIVTETNCLEVLLKLCVEYKEREDEVVVAELFYTLDKLSIRNEFCQRILDLGGVDYIIEALENHVDSLRIATSSFAVLKSLAANDRVKVEIGKKNGLNLMIRALEKHIHHQNSCVNGFGALSAVTLRTQENSRILVRMGLPQLLKQAIQIHSEQKHFDVLRPVCLTTRNVVARCPELVQELLEAGLEEWLNVVLNLGRECDDEAKAALRDLGCKVVLKEPWTGKMGVKVKQ